MPVIKMNNNLSAFVKNDKDKSVSSFKPDIQRHVYTPVEKPANLKKEFTNSEFGKWQYLHENDVLKRVGLKSFEELFKCSKAATIRQKVHDVDTETQARAIKQAIQSNNGIDESVLDDSRFSKEVWKDVDLIDYETETASTVHQIENLIKRYEDQKKADFDDFCHWRMCSLTEEEYRFCRLFWMMNNKDVLKFVDTRHIHYLNCFPVSFTNILTDCTMKLISCESVEEYHQKLKSGVFGDTSNTTKLIMTDAEQKLWSYVEKASEWLSGKEQELREVEGAKVRAKEIKARDDAFKARLKSKLEELESVNADLRQKNEVRKMQDWIDKELC